MRRGITRGLLIGLAATVVILIYVLLRYGYRSTPDFLNQLSTDLFQIGLLLLIIGVVIVSRLFRFRRQMGLPNYGALFRSRTREEYQEHMKVSDELREKDEEEVEERGRDLTLLIAASVTIVIAILLTINRV